MSEPIEHSGDLQQDSLTFCWSSTNNRVIPIPALVDAGFLSGCQTIGFIPYGRYVPGTSRHFHLRNRSTDWWAEPYGIARSCTATSDSSLLRAVLPPCDSSGRDRVR